MPLTQLAPPYPIFTDKNGDPLDAGFIYFGEPNQNPETTPITVYYDRGFTQPVAQPIRTSNGYIMRNGSPALIYADSQFSVTVRNKNSELVIYSPVGFGIVPGIPFAVFENSAKDVYALLADTFFTYNAVVSGAIQVSPGDILRTLAEGFAYEVAPSGASDEHVITAGGVKLYVLPQSEGYVTPQQFGFVENVITDQSAIIQQAVDAFPWVHFPPMASGYYYMGSSDLVLASTASPRNDVKLTGGAKGANGPRASRILFGSAYGMKVNGTSGSYCLFRLQTKDLFFGPVDSVSRSTPIFDFTGLAYWDRDNCHFQGDTLRQQPVLRGRWSLGITSRGGCNIWGGLIGEDYGTAADPLNGIDCFGDNHNGSRYAGQYAVTAFKKYGGLVQSCGDGFDFSSQKLESSSAIVIDGVYFENNKFWNGSAFTGRDITLGETVFCRNVRIENNYHAQLTADNPFTSGQGKSTIPFVLLTRVQGGSICNNFWTSGGVTSYVELGHHNQGGIRFPNNLRIKGNTDLFIDQHPSVTWKSSVIGSQKLALFSNDLIQIQDWTESEIGIVKTARSPLVTITGTGTQFVPIMESMHFGGVKAIRLVCSDGFIVVGTLDVGVLAAPSFYVSGFSLGTKSSYTTTSVTQNNTVINSANGPIIARIDVTGFTAAGNFTLEVDYCDVLE